MRHKIVPVKNVARLRNAGDALIQRSIGLPGMGLIWGPTGYGKTTAATWFINRCHGVYIRAMRLWTPKSMLHSLARELDVDIKGLNNIEGTERIVQRLSETNRPVFVDEADYVVEKRMLTDTLRDIHDLATVPLILIGMHGIKSRIEKVRHNEQFSGRIAQEVEFEGIDMDDARLMTDQLAEVRIADDLLERLHQKAKAEVRRLVVGLGRIEQYARSRGLGEISAAQLPARFDFFMGQAVSTDPEAKPIHLRPVKAPHRPESRSDD